MANFHYNENADPSEDEVALYYCESCQVFHVTAGPMTLSLDAHEFASFIDRATETYWEQALRGKVQTTGVELRPVNLPLPESTADAGH
jgi:hypothetical protein